MIKLKCRGKKILRNRGKTMKWLSEEIEMDYKQLNDILNDRYQGVDLRNAYIIARGLNLDIEDVWEFEET